MVSCGPCSYRHTAAHAIAGARGWRGSPRGGHASLVPPEIVDKETGCPDPSSWVKQRGPLCLFLSGLGNFSSAGVSNGLFLKQTNDVAVIRGGRPEGKQERVCLLSINFLSSRQFPSWVVTVNYPFPSPRLLCTFSLVLTAYMSALHDHTVSLLCSLPTVLLPGSSIFIILFSIYSESHLYIWPKYLSLDYVFLSLNHLTFSFQTLKHVKFLNLAQKRHVWITLWFKTLKSCNAVTLDDFLLQMADLSES